MFTISNEAENFIAELFVEQGEKDLALQVEIEKADFMNKMFIENVWCFGPETDLFKNSRVATLEDVF